MAREGTYLIRLTFCIDAETKDKLDELCKALAISRSALIRQLIREKYYEVKGKAIEASEELKAVEEKKNEEDSGADREIKEKIIEVLNEHNRIPYLDIINEVHECLDKKYAKPKIGEVLNELVVNGEVRIEEVGNRIYVLKK